MKLENAYESVPDDDDLLYSIEHWDSEECDDHDDLRLDSLVEAFVHPNTGTAARILSHEEGEYSVQPTMGDFAGFDNVHQSPDPGTFVSGSSSVVVMELESLSEARAAAYFWMRGWVMRNSSIGTDAGDVYDSES